MTHTRDGASRGDRPNQAIQVGGHLRRRRTRGRDRRRTVRRIGNRRGPKAALKMTVVVRSCPSRNAPGPRSRRRRNGALSVGIPSFWSSSHSTTIFAALYASCCQRDVVGRRLRPACRGFRRSTCRSCRTPVSRATSCANGHARNVPDNAPRMLVPRKSSSASVAIPILREWRRPGRIADRADRNRGFVFEVDRRVHRRRGRKWFGQAQLLVGVRGRSL